MFEHITKVLTGLKLIKFINSLIDLINSHLSNYNNPHKVTAEQLGLSNAYKYKGSVPTYQDLPSTAESGDVYNVVKGDKEIGFAAFRGRVRRIRVCPKCGCAAPRWCRR